MKSAKERKMDRKRKHKALAVAKTEKSRQRRLDNKAKRDEIHAIDPDIKVKVIDQVTYDDLGTKIMVENGRIKSVEPILSPPIFGEDGHMIDYSKTVEVFKSELKTSEEFDQKLQDRIEKIEAVKVDDVSKFKKIINKWRL
jgi:hypothetical protein